MKPFYSIDELEDLLDRDILEIADGLRASGVEMIYNGVQADLSRWYLRRATVDEGGRVLVRAGALADFPAPVDVVVATDALPVSWLSAIRAAIASNELRSSHLSADRELGTRERNNLLRIIRALVDMAKLPPTGFAESIICQLEDVGVRAPSDDLIRRVVAQARGLDS